MNSVRLFTRIRASVHRIQGNAISPASQRVTSSCADTRTTCCDSSIWQQEMKSSQTQRSRAIKCRAEGCNGESPVLRLPGALRPGVGLQECEALTPQCRGAIPPLFHTSSWLMRSPYSRASQLLNKSTDLNGIWYEYFTGGHPELVLFNVLQSVVPIACQT
jgi:hypothetical protein